MFDRGSNYHLKSVFQSGPRTDVFKSVFEKVCELNAAPGNEIQYNYIFEYTSPRVLLTIPEDATAFLRTHRVMTGCAFKWSRKSPSIEDAARRAAQELTSIVAEAEAQISGENNSGYGNFSQCHLVF
jgi:hypothetical protein